MFTHAIRKIYAPINPIPGSSIEIISAIAVNAGFRAFSHNGDIYMTSSNMNGYEKTPFTIADFTDQSSD